MERKMRSLALLLFTLPAIAATPGQEAALKEIDAFTTAQARSDPHYAKVEAELMDRVDEMVKTQPPAEWAPTVKRWYFSLSERAHAEERARIRDAEGTAAGGIVAPSPAAAGKLIDRMEALERDLLAGKLGPRQHALHVLEAARAIFPEDRHLITLREVKVGLATDYELGNITRGQYDERWARARAAYQQNADARERAILEDMRAEQAAVGRRSGPSLGERIRQQRGITCTSVPGPLGITTNCR